MPLSLADVLSAQAGGGPVYEGGPDANVTPGGVLAALGLGGPSWLDAAQKQTGADIAAYQRGGVPELMADTGQTQELAGGFVGSTTPAKAGPIVGVGGPSRAADLWHDISQVKLRKPISEMQPEITPSTIQESRVTPAELQGGYLLPAIGDRSAAGSQLLGIGGNPLERQVELQGGHGYMPAQSERGVVWASAPGVARGIESKAAGLAEKGDVYFPYTAMSARSVDFSHHVSDALSEMLPTASLTREGQAAFNAAMKTEGKDFGAITDWPGVRSPRLRDYLAEAPGEVRNKFAKLMDTARFQDAGFPSVAEARHAVTDPRLLDVPTGASGLSISQLSPGSKAAESAHRTYEAAIPGQYVGGFGTSVPKEVMYPDVVRSLEAYRDKLPGYKPTIDYLMSRTPRGEPIAQRATQKWVDQMSQYLRERGLLPALGTVTLADVLMASHQEQPAGQ